MTRMQTALLKPIVLAGAVAMGSCGERPSVGTPAPTAPPSTTACTDMTLGVCRVADAVIRHIALTRAGANGITVDPASGLVYVVINGVTAQWCGDKGPISSGLSIVDPTAGREIALVATSEGPVWPVIDPTRGKVYVAGSGGNGSVAVHAPRTGVLERTFALGGRPHDLGLDPGGNLLLVSNTFDKSQTWISLLNVDNGSVTANISVPELPHKVVVDDNTRTGYVVSLGSGQITAIDLARGSKLREFSSGAIPQTSAMIFSPRRRLLYVAKTAGTTPTSGNTVVAVDVASGAIVGAAGTFTPASSVPTRAWGGFGLDDTNGLLYAAMSNTNLVAVVDIVTMKPVAVFDVDACPWAVTLDVSRGVGYVSSNQAAALTVFDLAKVMRAIGR